VKLQFPLYLVVDPTPVLGDGQTCLAFATFAEFEDHIRAAAALHSKYQSRGPVLYDVESEALYDARCRIAARGTKKASAPRDPAALLSLLDRIDTNGRSLPEDIRAEIVAALDGARAAGWRPTP